MKTNYKTSHYIHLKVENIIKTKMIKPNQTTVSIIDEINHKINDLEQFAVNQSRKIYQMIDKAEERLHVRD